jgi:predicted PurR-regulated permease PerM
MSEPKVNERKMVRRSVAIALGIICIILLVGLLGTIVLISSLNSQVNDLTITLNLGKSTVWLNDKTVGQPASSYTSWTFSASELSYAGYASVNVQTSTTGNTYAEVIYSSHGVNYDNQISVGTGATAVFPVLPASSIEIRVGNTNGVYPWASTPATETVTVTYYY